MVTNCGKHKSDSVYLKVILLSKSSGKNSKLHPSKNVLHSAISTSSASELK